MVPSGKRLPESTPAFRGCRYVLETAVSRGYDASSVSVSERNDEKHRSERAPIACLCYACSGSKIVPCHDALGARGPITPYLWVESGDWMGSKLSGMRNKSTGLAHRGVMTALPDPYRTRIAECRMRRN